MSGFMFQQKRPLIHIVDDDNAVLASLSLLLESEGLRVVLFNSCRAYLSALLRSDKQILPQCLLLDASMPDMTGPDLQEHLRSSRLEIPTIVMTGRPHGHLVERARSAGARDVLAKPIDPLKLLASVYRYVTL